MRHSNHKHFNLWLWIFGLLALLFLINAKAMTPDTLAAPSESVTKARLVETYGKLPLSFEVNQGQTDSKARFLSRGSGYGLFLTSTGAVLSLHQSKAATQETNRPTSPTTTGKTLKNSSREVASTLHIRLIGGNPDSTEQTQAWISLLIAIITASVFCFLVFSHNRRVVRFLIIVSSLFFGTFSFQATALSPAILEISH